MKSSIIRQVIFITIAATNLALATNYYVRRAGNDQSSGTSWNTAWATVNRVNSSVAIGDTVRFGAGIYLGSRIVPPANNNNPTWTVYACSTFATQNDPNGSQTWLDPIIVSGVEVSGWSVYSGNIYRASWDGGLDPSGANNDIVCVVIDESGALLQPNTNLSGLNESNECYYDPSGHYLYVWLPDGSNPSGHTVWASRSHAMDFCPGTTGRDYVYVVGLDLRMGREGTIFMTYTTDHTTFYHCSMKYMAHTIEVGNGGVIWSVYQNGSQWAAYNSFIACDIGYAVDTRESAGDGSGASIYSHKYVLFDSCTIHDTQSSGIYFKEAYGSNWNTGSVVRFCTFYNIGEYGVELYRKADRDSIYGCYFIGINNEGGPNGATAIQMYRGGDDGDHLGDCYIANNTFYNCASGIEVLRDINGTDNTEFKYNIYYDRYTSGYFLTFYPGDFSDWTLDSNYYYDPTSSFQARYNGSTRNWSSWQGLGYDVHSFNTNPDMANPAGWDFARPNAIQEMDRFYGGKHWTLYGAWQPPDAPDEDPPEISGVNATNITDIEATVVWHTNEYATSQVFYGLSTAYGDSTLMNHFRVLNHSVNLTGLQPNTLYHYQVRSLDASNNEGISGDYTFQTAMPDTVPPVISNVASSGVTDVSAAITWTTDEAATSRVQYGLTYNYELATPLDSALIINHQINLNNLTPDTLYYFRVLSRDARNNERISAGYNFHTDTVSTYQNLALLDTMPRVCGTYEGYTIEPINDGMINQYGGASTTWASDDSMTDPHWIVIDFGGPLYDVENVVIYWAWNAYSSSWMCSRQYHLQYWDQSINGYADAAVVNNSSADSISTTAFPTVTTSRMRYLQPAGMGPQTYTSILWLAELEIYGNEADSTGPIYTPTPLLTVVDTADFRVTLVSSTIECEIPVYYEFALDSLPDFPEPAMRIPLTVDSVAAVTYDSLNEEVLYYWRCRAMANDNSDSSDWSDSTCFNIVTGIVQSLSTADCIYPTEGTVVHSSRPVFTVNNIRNIDYYYIQVDDDPLFTSPIESGPILKTSAAVTNWQLSDPLEQGQSYVWRVSGGNNGWTSPISFTAELDIHPYPNPFRAADGYPSITFTNLPQNAKIIISTISGKIIKRQKDIGPGDWIWDVKSDKGEELAPGVYPFSVDSPSGPSSGKVVVIK